MQNLCVLGGKIKTVSYDENRTLVVEILDGCVDRNWFRVSSIVFFSESAVFALRHGLCEISGILSLNRGPAGIRTTTAVRQRHQE